MQQENNEEFERYRRQMHGNDDDNNRRQGSGRLVRWVYTIFMVVLYIGMGILLLLNFFEWAPEYTWPRNIVGIVLIIYGIWRAYRHYAGIGSRL